MQTRLLPFGVLAASLTLLATGCHSPGGALINFTGGTQTYASTESSPKTVVVTDVRSGEVVFEQEIPPGKQLTMDFLPEEGDDPVMRPDLMRYEVWEIGTRFGKLRNVLPVPNAASRRVDFYIRETLEYAPEPENLIYRTDQMADTPSWWTPEGGDMPDDGKQVYDD